MVLPSETGKNRGPDGPRSGLVDWGTCLPSGDPFTIALDAVELIGYGLVVVAAQIVVAMSNVASITATRRLVLLVPNSSLVLRARGRADLFLHR